MASKIWIVLQHRDGKITRMAWEAVAAGQKLAAKLGGTAEAVLLGSDVGELAREVAGRDLAAVHVGEHEALADYTPGAAIGALAPAIESEGPDYVLFPHTYQTVDFVPRLAQTVGAGLLSEITGFEEADGDLVWSRPVLGGKLISRVRVKGEGTVLVSVQSGSFPADDAASGEAEIRQLELDPSRITPDREILAVEDVAGDQVDLSTSEIIVAVGRGLGGPENIGPIEALAKALGAEIAASRPVIDNEWLPRERQIGSSGQTVAPKLYLAAGISGAIQHVVGMKGSKVVVAINKDANAPIFNLADYGIVGDLHEIVPALTAAVEEARG